jgi:hypothetical protein
MVIDTINKSRSIIDFKTLIALVAILAIGSSTPVREITRTTAATIDRIRNNQSIPLDAGNIWRNIYCGYIKDNVFFDYLATLPKEKQVIE